VESILSSSVVITRRRDELARGNATGRFFLKSELIENARDPRPFGGSRSTTPSHHPVHVPGESAVGITTSIPSVLNPHESTTCGWASSDERPDNPCEGRRERNGVRFSVHR